MVDKKIVQKGSTSMTLASSGDDEASEHVPELIIRTKLVVKMS